MALRQEHRTLPGEAIHIRRYTPDDLEHTVCLWRASKRAAYPYVAVQQRYTLAEDTAYFRDVVAVHCVVWLAEVAGRLAGLIALKEDFIDQLYVALEQQRHEVGTALLQKVREHSPAGLRLYTFQKNLSARAFYEKHGFHTIRYGVSPALEHEPDVEYHWRP